MPTSILENLPEKLGISKKQIVHYKTSGNKAIVEIELKKEKKTSKKPQKSAKQIFDFIVENSENLETDNWAEDFKNSKVIPD